MTYKIIHDRETCIGCGACASVAPDFWEMKDDGKSSIIGGEKTGNGDEESLGPKEDDTKDINMEAAESCPVNCIHIFEIKNDNSENKLI